MAIILVTQFNSFYHAFLILTAVIMSTVGVMAGLIITGQTFGIVMTGVGIIALAGIVVNNNIVLIDTYAHLRRQGMDAIEAVVRTGAQRLRPVALTTITTIFGLLPMVFQLNIDFFARDVSSGAPSTQWWVQLSTAVVFGLTFATLLTLIVTPSLLALGARTGEALARRRQRREEKRARKREQQEPTLQAPGRPAHAAE
jgi:multidrug efflux pump